MTARLTEADRAAIVAAYRSGEKINTIARRFGVHRSYPTILAKRSHMPIRRPECGWRP